MKITVDTTDILDGIQMEWITTDSHGGRPLSSRIFFLFGLIKVLLNSLLLMILLIPALVYVYLSIYFWPVLKAEGLTVWQLGTGLVAIYGLGLHWWRTHIQNKQYQVEMKKAYRSDL